MLELLSASPLVHAVGWALVHFVWQGALVAAVAAVLLAALAGRDPRHRYGLACAALAVMIVLPVATALWVYEPSRFGPSAAPPAASLSAPADVFAPPAADTAAPAAGGLSAPAARPSAANPLEHWFPLGVLAWLGGVLLLSLRTAGGWLLVRRLKRSGAPVAAEWLVAVESVKRRLGVARPVRTLASALVAAPTVIGWLRPVILLPASALTGLPPEQLRALIAHELAHVRRHDFLVNLAQTLAETLLFHHPAVWWLSGRIRLEREQCADDLAVAACGDPVVYAQALAGLESARTGMALELSAAGGALLGRIRRILGQPPARDYWPPVWVALSVVAIGVIVFAPAGGTMAGVPPPQAASPTPLMVAPVASTLRQTPGAPVIVAPVPGAVRGFQVAPLPAPSAPGAAVVTPFSSSAGIAVLPPVAPPVLSQPFAPGILTAPQASVFTWAPEQQADVFTWVRSDAAGWLGLSMEDGDERGVLVRSVEPGSPAEAAGIQAGDLVVGFDGERVVGTRQFIRIVGETPVGRTVAVSVVREGREQSFQVTLAARPSPYHQIEQFWSQPPAVVFRNREFQTQLDEARNRLNEARIRSQQPFWFSVPEVHVAARVSPLGLRVDGMTPELREFFGAARDAGVLVAAVEADSPAARAGVRVGDVIVAVNGDRIDAPHALGGAVHSGAVALTLVRDGAEMEVRIDPANP